MVREGCDRILKELGLPKINLILLHFPRALKCVDGKRTVKETISATSQPSEVPNYILLLAL